MAERISLICRCDGHLFATVDSSDLGNAMVKAFWNIHDGEKCGPATRTSMDVVRDALVDVGFDRQNMTRIAPVVVEHLRQAGLLNEPGGGPWSMRAYNLNEGDVIVVRGRRMQLRDDVLCHLLDGERPHGWNLDG